MHWTSVKMETRENYFVKVNFTFFFKCNAKGIINLWRFMPPSQKFMIPSGNTEIKDVNCVWFQKRIRQLQFSFHLLRTVMGITKIYGSKMLVLLNSVNLLLMYSTNTYKNNHTHYLVYSVYHTINIKRKSITGIKSLPNSFWGTSFPYLFGCGRSYSLELYTLKQKNICCVIHIF